MEKKQNTMVRGHKIVWLADREMYGIFDKVDSETYSMRELSKGYVYPDWEANTLEEAIEWVKSN